MAGFLFTKVLIMNLALLAFFCPPEENSSPVEPMSTDLSEAVAASAAASPANSSQMLLGFECRWHPYDFLVVPITPLIVLISFAFIVRLAYTCRNDDQFYRVGKWVVGMPLYWSICVSLSFLSFGLDWQRKTGQVSLPLLANEAKDALGPILIALWWSLPSLLVIIGTLYRRANRSATN